MTYLLLDSQGAIARYPASFADVKKANPQVSFPQNPSDDTLFPYGWRKVCEVNPPDYDSFSQTLNEVTPTDQLIDKQWRQKWEVIDIPIEELPYRCDYQAFWNALIAAPVYQIIRQQATTDLAVNTCCTEFIAAMTDAKSGRVNKDALQMCITLLMQALQLTTEQVTELNSILAVGNLNRVYTLTTS